MTKVTIKSKCRIWLRKLLLLLMALPSRCYLFLSSKTTLNCASNTLSTSKVLLWELTTATVIHFISDGIICKVRLRYVGNRAHGWLMLTFQWGHCTLGDIMVQPLHSQWCEYIIEGLSWISCYQKQEVRIPLSVVSRHFYYNLQSECNSAGAISKLDAKNYALGCECGTISGFVDVTDSWMP